METNDRPAAVMEFLMKLAHLCLIENSTVIYRKTIQKRWNSLGLSLPSKKNYPILHRSVNVYILKVVHCQQCMYFVSKCFVSSVKEIGV